MNKKRINKYWILGGDKRKQRQQKQQQQHIEHRTKHIMNAKKLSTGFSVCKRAADRVFDRTVNDSSHQFHIQFCLIRSFLSFQRRHRHHIQHRALTINYIHFVDLCSHVNCYIDFSRESLISRAIIQPVALIITIIISNVGCYICVCIYEELS